MLAFALSVDPSPLFVVWWEGGCGYEGREEEGRRRVVSISIVDVMMH